MKLRVLGLLGALLTILVVFLSIVMLQSISRAATQDLQLSRMDSLNRFVQLSMEAESQSDHGALLTAMHSYSQLFGEGIVVRVGNSVLSSPGFDPNAAPVREALHNAGLNIARTEISPLNPLASDTKLLARPFGNSSQVLGAVVMEVDPGPARDQILARWLLVVGAALFATIVLVILAWWVTSWVLRPIHRLNEAVEDFATTGTPKRLAEDGPPELRQLQRSFSSMSAVVTQSLSAQRELIAETSHQLRNPIAALRLRVDLLKMKLGASQPQALAAVEAELDSVERLLSAVLRLASAEHRASERTAHAGAQNPGEGTASIDPWEVLVEEFERFSARARAQDCPIRLANQTVGERHINCNGFELSQMVGELLTNALKYAAGSPIDLSLENSGEQVLITVRDRGAGLTPQQLKEAGIRFWRGGEHRHIEGSGLGLTIVERLAEANHGRLELSSPHGRGLQATLSFPSTPASTSGQEQP